MAKRPRDEHAPKRPQSSYFLYSNHRRKQLKTENPEKKITEISKMIAAEWSKMSDADKKPYEKDAQELKVKYDRDVQEYKGTKNYKEFQEELKKWKSDGNGSSKRKTKTKRPKDQNAPKKPQSAYFLFINERRPLLKEKHSDKKVTEISKLLGAEWKEMTSAKKKPWEDKAKELKEEYNKRMETYKKSDNYKKFQEQLKQSKKKGPTKKKKEMSEEESENGNESESGSESESEEKSKPKAKAKNTKSKKKESESDSESESESD